MSEPLDRSPDIRSCPTCGGAACFAEGPLPRGGRQYVAVPQAARHNCEEWREAIVGCAVRHEDYYGVRDARPTPLTVERLAALLKESRDHHPTFAAGCSCENCTQSLALWLLSRLTGEQL